MMKVLEDVTYFGPNAEIMPVFDRGLYPEGFRSFTDCSSPTMIHRRPSRQIACAG